MQRTEDFMLALFMSAYLGAIVSTIPVGPINIALMALAVRPQKANWYAAVLGVICIDGLFAILAYAMPQMEVFHLKDFLSTQSRILGEAVLLLMILIGIIFSKRHASSASRLNDQPSILSKAFDKDRPLVWFAAGLTATALEPGLPFFWLTWWLTFMDTFEPGMMPLILIVLAVVTGDFSVFKLYEKLGTFVSRRALAGKHFDPHLWSMRLLYGAFALITAHLLWQLWHF
jgi:threonine/homoserine/homoserine lactone efflux protein